MIPFHPRQFGRTPLIQAIAGGHLEVVKTLVYSGADVNAKDKVCV